MPARQTLSADKGGSKASEMSGKKRKVTMSPQGTLDHTPKSSDYDDAEEHEHSDPFELKECEKANHIFGDDGMNNRPKHVKGAPLHMQKRHWRSKRNKDGQVVGRWMSDRNIRELEKIEQRMESMMKPGNGGKSQKRKAGTSHLNKALEESGALLKNGQQMPNS